MCVCIMCIDVHMCVNVCAFVYVSVHPRPPIRPKMDFLNFTNLVNLDINEFHQSLLCHLLNDCTIPHHHRLFMGFM